MAGRVGGLRKHPHGRVDQLEDRYLGMVEAPSSNLGTSTKQSSVQRLKLDDLRTPYNQQQTTYNDIERYQLRDKPDSYVR